MDKQTIEKLQRYKEKIETITNLIKKEHLILSLDRLRNEKEVEQELLYIQCEEKRINKERKGFFLFGNRYFCDKLNDKEYKNLIGFNLLNYLILKTYNKIKTEEGASINNIVETILTEHSYQYLSKPKILKRILTLTYYHNLDFKKKDSEIDSDLIIKIPETFELKQKQRFNLDILIQIYEDRNYLIFINCKYDICFIYKEKEKIQKEDLKEFKEIISKIFNIKEITLRIE